MRKPFNQLNLVFYLKCNILREMFYLKNNADLCYVFNKMSFLLCIAMTF